MAYIVLFCRATDLSDILTSTSSIVSVSRRVKAELIEIVTDSESEDDVVFVSERLAPYIQFNSINCSVPANL